MTDEIVIVSKSFNRIILVNNDDIKYIGTERGLDVKCILVDLDNRVTYPIHEIEKYLKFGNWEETVENERVALEQVLYSRFSDDYLYNKVILPLSNNIIKPV